MVTAPKYIGWAHKCDLSTENLSSTQNLEVYQVSRISACYNDASLVFFFTYGNLISWSL